ncbi:MAG: TetR/AcrR family transcriptional regulator [Firmicutes bacterium]|nr:TetR/AcrR family transcriptional regulator [Bacillota bacterium]
MSRPLDKKELIRKAAIQVISRQGYYYATTDQIAEEAGVAVGTIYNYFRSKEEILEHIFKVEVDKRFRYYEGLVNQNLPALEKLQRLLTMHFAEVLREPQVGQIMVRERLSPEDQQLPGIRGFLQGVPSRLQTILEEAVAKGEIRPCDTEIVAAALFGSIEAVVSKAVFAQDQNKQKEFLQNAARELMDLYVRGLENR